MFLMPGTFCMFVAALDLESYIKERFNSLNIWTTDFTCADNLLRECTFVAEYWISTCTQLTQDFWPNYSVHAWIGKPVIPQNLSDLVSRIKQVCIYVIVTNLIKFVEVQDVPDLMLTYEKHFYF